MNSKIIKAVSQINLRGILKDYFLLTVGALLLSVNLNLFLLPANIAPGGVTGLALITNSFTGWPVGLTMLLLNIPMPAIPVLETVPPITTQSD